MFEMFNILLFDIPQMLEASIVLPLKLLDPETVFVTKRTQKLKF
jgi:hypothetical protein